MIRILIAAFTVSFLFSCKASKTVPSEIGLRTLTSYITKPSINLPDSINYMFFTDESSFQNSFVMTRTSGKSAVTPNFNNQSVVAIVMQPTTSIIELKLDAAEVKEKEMNVYYRLNKLKGSTFSQTAFAVATVPKAIDVKRVNFYVDNDKKKTVDVSF